MVLTGMSPPMITLFRRPPPPRGRFFTLCILHHHHYLHTSSQPPPLPSPTTEIECPLTHPIYAIWAANTSLGKTLVSAGLSITFLNSSCTVSRHVAKKFIYLKPIQTGFPDDSDSRFVYRKFTDFFLRTHPRVSVFASNHVLNASVPALRALLRGRSESENFGNGPVGASEKVGSFENLGWYEERKLQGLENGETIRVRSELICKTFYGWREPISPHLAVEREGARVEDSELLEILKRSLGFGGVGEGGEKDIDMMCVVETAGGVASPGPTGTLQCDLYRCVMNFCRTTFSFLV